MNEFELNQAANQIASVVLPRFWLQALQEREANRVTHHLLTPSS
jgi:hypothetical protein